jgi:hypothetical protein
MAMQSGRAKFMPSGDTFIRTKQLQSYWTDASLMHSHRWAGDMQEES